MAAFRINQRALVESAALQGIGQVREHTEEFACVAIISQTGGGHANCCLNNWYHAPFKQVVRQSDLK